MPGLAQDFGIGADGSVFAVDPAGRAWRWNGAASDWSPLAGIGFQRISVSAKGLPWAVGPDGGIFRFTGRTESWQRLPGAARDIDIGSDDVVFIVDQGGEPARWSARTRTWVRRSLPTRDAGKARRISVGADGHPVVLLSSGRILRFDGKTWRALQVRAREIDIAPSGALFAIDRSNRLVRLNNRNLRWERLGRSAVGVAVGPGDKAWVVSAENRLFASDLFRRKETAQNETRSAFRLPDVNWTLVPGSAAELAVGSKGDVFAADRNGAVWRWNRDSQDWSPFAAEKINRLAVSSEGQPWAVTLDGTIHRYDGVRWHRLPGRARDIAIGANQTVYIIDERGNPALWEELRRRWKPVELESARKGQGRRLAVDPNGRLLVVLSTGDLIRHERNVWTSLGAKARDVAVGPGGTIFIVAPDGTPRRWDARNARWEDLTRTGVVIAAGPRDRPWMAEESGRIWAADTFIEKKEPPARVARSGLRAGISISQVADLSPLTFVQIRLGPVTSAQDVGIGRDGTVFVVDLNGGLARFDPSRQLFDMFPGIGIGRVAVTADGNPWVVTQRGEVFRFDGSDWQRVLDITATDIAIGGDGTVLVTDRQGNVRRYEAASDRFSLGTLVSIKGRRVAATPKGAPWLLDDTGRVFRCDNGPCAIVPVPGAAKDISIGPAGSVFITSSADLLFRFNARTGQFDRIDQSATVVAAGPRDRPWVLTPDFRIFASAFFPRPERLIPSRVTGTPTQTSTLSSFAFQKNLKFTSIIPPFSVRDVVADTMGGLWAVGFPDGVIGKFSQLKGKIFQIPVGPVLPALSQNIGVGPKGRLWVTTNTGQIFEETTSGFRSRPGVATAGTLNTRQLISVGTDGTVVVIDRAGSVYRYDHTRKRFFRILINQGAFTAVDVAPDGRFWLIRSDSRLFQSDGTNLLRRPQTGLHQTARDVGVGADGSVWIVDLNNTLRKYNGLNDEFDLTNETIDVQVTVNYEGRPIVVRNGPPPLTGAWAESGVKLLGKANLVTGLVKTE